MSASSCSVFICSSSATSPTDPATSPRLLGALIAISGLGYAADSLGAVLSEGSWTDITSFTFIGEFLLALWLLIRARSIAVSTSALDEVPLPVTR